MVVKPQISTPVGLDKVIQSLQDDLAGLATTWGISNYNCYPRCYVNNSQDGNVVEYFDGTEYKQLTFNDRVDVESFFFETGTSQSVDGNPRIQVAPVALVFALNLENVYPLLSHRADMEVRRDILHTVQGNVDARYIQVDGVAITPQEVFAGLRDFLEDYNDMQPRHILRFDLQITYYLMTKC